MAYGGHTVFQSDAEKYGCPCCGEPLTSEWVIEGGAERAYPNGVRNFFTCHSRHPCDCQHFDTLKFLEPETPKLRSSAIANWGIYRVTYPHPFAPKE